MSEITCSVSVHVLDDEKFIPDVRVVTSSVVERKLFFCVDIGPRASLFMHHWQLVELRDKLTEAIKASPRKCQHPECEEERSATCDNCDARFCDEHGSKGGDRQMQDVGLVAYPSICWKCGHE